MTKVDDAELLVEIADGVRIRVVKSTLSEVRTKGEPAPASGKAETGKLEAPKEKEKASSDGPPV